MEKKQIEVVGYLLNEHFEVLEYLFNEHSRRFASHEDERDENHACMETLQRVVKLFGYKFKRKGVENVCGTECEQYELVKIDE